MEHAGRTVIYGVNPVVEAMMAGVEIDAIYLAVGLRASTRRDIEQLAKQSNIRVLKSDRHEMDRLSKGGSHQGVLAIAGRAAYLTVDELAGLERQPRTVIVCLDEVQDPHNLGAVARSALAFGAAGLLIPERRAAGVTAAAVKASAGALARIPVARVNNLTRALEILKERGFWIAGAVVEDGVDCWDFDPGNKVVLVLGSEGGGIRHGVEAALDHRIRIPILSEMESLNVSVAGALLLYEWWRQSHTGK